MTFEHDLGTRRYLQAKRSLTDTGIDDLVAAAAQQAGNWYSDSVSGTGVTAPRIVAGSAPSATATGKAGRIRPA